MPEPKEQDPVIVLFRKESDSSITAVFPELPASGLDPHQMTCYAHIGQHSGCTYSWYRTTTPASPEEYADLKAELESIGYNLVVKQRMHRSYTDKRIAAMRINPHFTHP